MAANAATYAAAETFVDRALRRDDSLLTPGVPIWSLANLDELDEKYVRRPEVGEGSFEDKLKVQLADASPSGVQLMAEILFAYYLLAHGNITGTTKRERLNQVLGWLPDPVSLPSDLDAVLDGGVGSGGVGFQTFKWASVAWFVRFGQHWKRLSDDERGHALTEPWEFLRIVDQVSTEGGGTYAREAMLHLVHPETFERVFSRGDKWAIAERFASLVTDEAPQVDRKIAEIRAKLSLRFGEDFDFYSTRPVWVMWKPRQNRWEAFLFWARRYFEEPNFDDEERTYKLEAAELIGEARKTLSDGGSGWQEQLQKALRNNLTDFRARDRWLKWVASHEAEAGVALRAVLDVERTTADAVEAFLDHTPHEAISTPGNRISIGSVLRMGVEPHDAPPYRPAPIQIALSLTEFGTQEGDEIGRYRQALDLFGEVLRRGREDGIELRDLLDAQSVVWCVTTAAIPAVWPAEDRAALEWYRAQSSVAEEDNAAAPVIPGTPAGVPAERVAESFAGLARRLSISEENLVEIAQLLEDKRQIVFYGPPGTGKTYVAKELAAVLAGDRSRVRIVQFHPSYSYEDFVEGFRPRLHDGVPGFELVPGPLKRLAADARADPDHLHVLVIDEMNRGNVAKVLGELYFLLEYRDENVELQYSTELFSLPTNLRIIGTMNTADRSIAILDAALRRRFAFVPFSPDREPIAGLLRRWLKANREGMTWVADVVDAANEKLHDRNGAIGPSFFLRSDLDEATVGLIWKHQILPYLEDHFFDVPERLAEFDLERLRAGLSRPSPIGPSDGDAGVEIAADLPD